MMTSTRLLAKQRITPQMNYFFKTSRQVWNSAGKQMAKSGPVHLHSRYINTHGPFSKRKDTEIRMKFVPSKRSCKETLITRCEVQTKHSRIRYFLKRETRACTRRLSDDIC